MSIKPIEKKDTLTGEWERALRGAVLGLRYGSVEVVVHDGRVVQIETRERVRFAQEAHRPPDDRGRHTLDECQAKPDDRRPAESGGRGER